jgi:hypothetical protein
LQQWGRSRQSLDALNSPKLKTLQGLWPPSVHCGW